MVIGVGVLLSEAAEFLHGFSAMVNWNHQPQKAAFFNFDLGLNGGG